MRLHPPPPSLFPYTTLFRSTYRTWFLWDARIKNFRSIRRGLQEVIAEIRADTFGNAYRGSSLEDRKSTRLNSSHGYISYAVFCLKNKTAPLCSSRSATATTV